MKKFKNVLQLKVNLEYSNPNIYRVFYFPAKATFLQLHAALQDVMGWSSGHMYQFIKNRTYIGIPDGDEDWEETLDISKTKIDQFLKKEKDTIVYEYDFGDSWKHKIVVEKIFEEVDLPQLPYCKTAKRACPFEDCGGIGGYELICEIASNPSHADYEDYFSMYDLEDFDPNKVSVDDINDLLSVFDEVCNYAKDQFEDFKDSI